MQGPVEHQKRSFCALTNESWGRPDILRNRPVVISHCLKEDLEGKDEQIKGLLGSEIKFEKFIQKGISWHV